MTQATEISNAIASGKALAISWASTFVSKVNNGEDIQSHENKLILLASWIDILEDYEIENFEDGSVIEPDVECLTWEQVQLIISKINRLCS